MVGIRRPHQPEHPTCCRRHQVARLGIAAGTLVLTAIRLIVEVTHH